ncbi:bluetail domain-containing putative surface protein [Cylindrospermopsis raciborskii]|uniref:bluetail domain-containing putative surface protein n=1 Tax=Cylindrospermopsis raciborskii TaxID=77022 RepID=UPI001B3AFE71
MNFYTGISTVGTRKTVSFTANSSKATVTVNPTPDTRQEGNETVSLTLASGNGYTVGTTSAVTGTITNDDFIGNASNNTLTGTAGNDHVNGGIGQDTLTGGAGNDVFVFQFGQSGVSGADRISDFAIGSDKIDLLSLSGAGVSDPTAFTRASNSTASSLANMVNNVFTDADGSLVGNQGLGINSAALVGVTTLGIAGTYLVINDGVAGFQSGNDLLVNITGYSGALPSFGTIPVTSFFV